MKRGLVVQKWTLHESPEKELAIYEAASQDAREDWRLQVEALHAQCVDETPWDFGQLDEPESEPEPETDLVSELG